MSDDSSKEGYEKTKDSNISNAMPNEVVAARTAKLQQTELTVLARRKDNNAKATVWTTTWVKRPLALRCSAILICIGMSEPIRRRAANKIAGRENDFLFTLSGQMFVVTGRDLL